MDENVVKTTKRFNPRVLSRISGDTGMGFLAMSIALYSGTIAVNKFRGAYAGRKTLID